MTRTEEIERSIITKYRKKIWRPFMKAIRDYDLIQENDKVAVCISGGKDSNLLAKCLEELQKHGKVKFDIEYIVMDPGYNKVNRKKIIDNANTLGININIFKSDIFDITDKLAKDSPCYLCARMRRGFLYARAQELGCNKIALGHHFDDVIETILLNMFYGSTVKSMMPKLHSENFEGLELIRPLYLVREKDIITWRDYHNLTFLNCACKLTEEYSLGQRDSKRYEVKNIIKELKKQNKYIDINIFTAFENVNLDKIVRYVKDGEEHTFLEEYDKDI